MEVVHGAPAVAGPDPDTKSELDVGKNHVQYWRDLLPSARLEGVDTLTFDDVKRLLEYADAIARVLPAVIETSDGKPDAIFRAQDTRIEARFRVLFPYALSNGMLDAFVNKFSVLDDASSSWFEGGEIAHTLRSIHLSGMLQYRNGPMKYMHLLTGSRREEVDRLYKTAYLS